MTESTRRREYPEVMKHFIVGRAQAGAEESDDEASSVDHVQVG